MEGSGTKRRKKRLNVEFIQERLGDIIKHSDKARHCDLVLVIGPTGVGKSTLCNYLHGFTMTKFWDGRSGIKTVEQTYIKIGHGVGSETLFATTIPIGNALCLVDTPGYFGDKSVEESVIENISTELTVRKGKQIKGVLILLSINAILETRLTEGRRFIRTLFSVFRDPVEMLQYSIIIITKKSKWIPEKEARKETIGAFKSLVHDCKLKAKMYRENPDLSSSEGIGYVEYDKIAGCFSAILESQDIIFVDPLDGGQTRQLICDRINSIKSREEYLSEFAKAEYAFAEKVARKTIGANTKEEKEMCPITKDDFCFSECNEYRQNFNQVMYDNAYDAHMLIKRIRCTAEECLTLCKDIAWLQSNLLTLNRHLSDLTEENFKTEAGNGTKSAMSSKSIENLQSMVVRNEKRKQDIEIEVKQNKLQLETLAVELAKMDTDDPMQHRYRA